MYEYLQLFESLPFPCLLLERKKNVFVIKDANARYCAMSCRKKANLLGSTYLELYSENQDRDINFKARFNALQKAFSTGKPTRTDTIRYDYGTPGELEERFWQIENIPIKDASGEVILVCNIARDVTSEVKQEKEKQEAKEELVQNLEKQQHWIKKNPDGLYAMDCKGNFLSVNEGLEKLAEVEEQDLLKMNFMAFCAPKDQEKIKSHFQKSISGKRQYFEAGFISANKNFLILAVSLIPMKIAEEICGVYGIAKNITSLRNTEEELYKSQRMYKALVQEASDFTAILNQEGTYKFVSESSTRILGRAPETFLGKNAFDFVHPEDKERVMQDFNLLEHEKQVRIEPFRFADKENNWRWIETTVTDLRTDPFVDGVVVNSREVTDLVSRSQEVEQLYESYHLASAATDDLIYEWDLVRDKVFNFHKGTGRIFGYEKEKINSESFWENHIHPNDLPVVRDTLKDGLANPDKHQVKTTYRFERANGTFAHVMDRAQIVRDSKGEAVRVIGAASDISLILNNRQALKIANKRFTYAMRATTEMIWDWDIKHGFIKRSSSFKRIFGYSTPRNPSIENFWFEKITEKDRDRVRKSLYKSLKNKETKKWKAEYCFIKADGETAYVIDRGFILRDKEGHPLRMVGSALDVSESRRLLHEVKKQNEVLKQVAWEQSHVVRAPLARLKALVRHLETDTNEEWSREELCRLINESAEEVDGIIRKIVKKSEEMENEKHD